MKSQSQFNWIFIIIVGAVILTFFINFGLKYKSLQDEKLSIELLINLDNSLSALQSSPYNTFDSINAPKELGITCNRFNIGGRNYTNTKFIFSPKNLKDELYVYYKPFNFPFKIDNFYYIISKNNKFFLVYSDQKARNFAESLMENLPDKFKERVILVTNRQPNGKNIFINPSVGTSLNDFRIIINNDKISMQNKNRIYDDVNQELVYGMIFSDDFECYYDKLKPDVEKVSLAYQNKIKVLQSSVCNYAGFSNYLSKLKELKYDNIKPIQALNENLASLNCPTLY